MNKDENKLVLDERIAKIRLENKTIIAFDFDELVIPIHLSKKVTDTINEGYNVAKLKELGSCSFEGIGYLNDLFVGINFQEYVKKREEIVRATPWREGFEELIRILMQKYIVIFISSGMKDIAESKLNEIGFNPEYIFGGEFEIRGDKIVGSKLIISDELKGYIISSIKRKNKVIGIGHGEGDREMLKESDLSIGFNPDIPDLSQHIARTPKEIMEIILKNS